MVCRVFFFLLRNHAFIFLISMQEVAIVCLISNNIASLKKVVCKGNTDKEVNNGGFRIRNKFYWKENT